MIGSPLVVCSLLLNGALVVAEDNVFFRNKAIPRSPAVLNEERFVSKKTPSWEQLAQPTTTKLNLLNRAYRPKNWAVG